MDNKRVFLVFWVLALLAINLQAEPTTELGVGRKNVEENRNAYSVSETTMDEKPGEPEKQASEVVRVSRGLSSYTSKDTTLGYLKRFSLSSLFQKSKAKNSMNNKHRAEDAEKGMKFSLANVFHRGLKAKDSTHSKHHVENHKKFSLGALLRTEKKPHTNQHLSIDMKKVNDLESRIRFTLASIFLPRPKSMLPPRPVVKPRIALDLSTIFKSGPRATSTIEARKNLGEPTTSGLEREHYVAYDKVSDEASKAVSTASNMAGEVKDSVKNGASKVVSQASNVAGEAKNEASQVAGQASNIASTAKDGVQNGASKVESQASNVAGEAKDSVQNGASQVASQASNAASEVKNSEQNGASQVADKASNVASQASNVAGEAKDSVQNGASQVANQASNVASEAKNGASQVANQASNAMQNGASQVADKTSNISSDAKNGIKNKTNSDSYTAEDKIEELEENSKRRAESTAEASRMGATDVGSNA